MSGDPIDLATFRVVLARAQQTSKDDGTTLDISDQKINELPIEIIELMKEQVARLALGHNLLSTLPMALINLGKLRYLNVRSNFFREFPQVLCDLPALEILDISRNKIRSLPRNIGNLMNLKVLSISKNRIEVLPNYIGRMNELRILKIDHNPVVYPPAEITSHEGGEDSMDAWLANLKEFLNSQDDSRERLEEDSDGLTSDDEGTETDFNTISKSGYSDLGGTSVTQTTLPPSNPISTGFNNTKRRQPPPPIPTKNSHRMAAMHGVNSKSVSNMHSFQSHPFSSAAMERSRSNSESEDLRRLSRRPVAMQRNLTGLGTLMEDRARHSRGFSHDYIQENTFEGDSSIPSPAEVQQNSRAYFRRLSSLPQSKRISLSSAKIVEASRGMLFSLSQIHMAIRQYVTFCADPELTGTINRVLYNANAHVGTLVDVLEAHEHRPDGAEATPVIEACRACVGAFKHVINILFTRVKDLTAQADVRYTRTLLLLLYGAAAEIQNSWNTLDPVPITHPASNVLMATTPAAASAGPVLGIVPRAIAPPTTRMKSTSNASSTTFTLPPSVLKMNDPFSVPLTPSDADADTDEQLYEKIAQATTATLSLLSLLGDAVSRSAQASAQGPATPGAVAPTTSMKLRDLASNSMNAGEVTRRLKNKLTNSKLLQDAMEKKKFWEDANLFVKAVINVAALAKSISAEYPFSKAILASLSAVTRSTKELTILLSVSSFSQTVRANDGPPSQTMAHTPLAVSLGPVLAGTTREAEFSPPAPPLVATPQSVALVMNGLSQGLS